VSQQDLIRRFLDMLASERGASPNTLSAYRSDLEDAAHILARAGQDLMDADTEALRGFLLSLQKKQVSAATTARKTSALRQFYRFLYGEGLRADDPAGRLKSPRQARPLPKVLSVDDVTHLLDQAGREAQEVVGEDDAEAEAGLSLAARRRAARMLALLELIYATGLRVSELIALPDSLWRMRERLIVVKGKGGKERLVPLTDKAMAALLQWRKLRDQRPDGTIGQASGPWLFPSDSESGHITRQAFARDLKDLAHRAGLSPQTISPHVLRHAFASHLLQNGADLRIVQQLLGHADIATTQIYTHVLDDRLTGMVRDLHPLADEG
jgi:integrase/recombinase XerD